MADRVLSLNQFKTLRKDNWWLQPLLVVVGLGGFAIYATWAALQNAHYFVDPYLSPFYSPCLASNCTHVSLPIIGSWWNLSPAFLILWIPGGFRATCYYYRKAYYRSFFLSPPACAVRDASRSYTGETRFPFLLHVLTEDEFVIFDAMCFEAICERVRSRTDQGHLSSQHLSSRRSSYQAQGGALDQPCSRAHFYDDELAAHFPSPAAGAATKRKHSIGSWNLSQYQE